jgi:hypothetical protein
MRGETKRILMTRLNGLACVVMLRFFQKGADLVFISVSVTLWDTSLFR